jgi:hypothetical protein
MPNKRLPAPAGNLFISLYNFTSLLQLAFLQMPPFFGSFFNRYYCRWGRLLKECRRHRYLNFCTSRFHDPVACPFFTITGLKIPLPESIFNWLSAEGEISLVI